MGPYVCSDADRRADLASADGFNGVDGVEADSGHPPDVPAWQTLLVECLLAIPDTLAAADVEIRPLTSGVAPVPVLWAYPAHRLAAARVTDPRVSRRDVEIFGQVPEAASTLVVRTAAAGSAATYRLGVSRPAIHHFDPRLCSADFTFRLDCLDETDPRPSTTCPPERSGAVPVIDYVNRDYAGLRGMLLDRLSLVLPQWIDRNPADLGVLLVELFAYVGDHLASAQDAAAAEAYLGTARRRISIARHARLLDYRMHQGVAARVWLVATAKSRADRLVLDAGTEVCAPGEERAWFHTLHPLTLRVAQNEIPLYTWGDRRCCLPPGATSATLVGTVRDLRLRAGDALLFEEARGGTDGRPEEADPSHRWVVRLADAPVDDHDPVTGTDVVAVTWSEEDALPFPLCAWSYPQGRCAPPLGAAVARGNVVLAEHGRLVEPRALVPPQAPARGTTYRPVLPDRGLAFCVPYDDASARARPATAQLDLPPDQARPTIESLTDGRRSWSVSSDLVTSTPFAPEFVVETEDDGRARIRFGNGVLGRRPTPGDRFTASYRIGGGSAGNVGAGVLTALVSPVGGVSIHNPLPAAGGLEPEGVEQVRQWAPHAFRVQERAVTDHDYAEIVRRDPRVQRALATRQWTGSWYAELVTVDRSGGGPVDGGFREDLLARLARARLAGFDVAVSGPVFVPLDIVLTVCVRSNHRRDEVRRALRTAFASSDTPDGPGFFHPDRFTFAQPVYLSGVVAAAMAVPGVRWVGTAEGPGSPNRFRRWGLPSAGERKAGRIPIDRLEVARCDSDADHPENGRIDFVVEGGL
ncbi:MAG TPA: putative baseplate assembly protein [Microlunatus sp.]